ncbi:MAG: glycoside hydrolase family 3 C-terminal domain-containing protein [Acidobacteriota bacterium]
MRPFGSCVVAGWILPLVLAASSHAATPPKTSPDARARTIVARMTLDEKIAQLHGIKDATRFRYVPGIPRLGIPALRITNGPAGVSHGAVSPQEPATALPAPIALAASWDVDLARRYGLLAAQESRALGYDLLESPDVNIIRVPQNGRAFECFTEDPFLDSRLAVASIEGTQSIGVLANVKHYIANDQETDRRSVNGILDERTLREIYMPAFDAAIHEANVASLMCAYPKVNNAFSCENGPLLNDVLKKEWHFQGFVISDYGAVHSTAPSALNGLDLEMPVGEFFADPLKQAVQQGIVPIARIDDMLVRRYAQMIRFGLFSPRPKPRPIDVWKNGAEARDMAEQGIVLLKNANNILPLDGTKMKTVVLIGPAASHAKDGGGGSSHVLPFYTIEPADGVLAHTPLSSHVNVLDGSDIASAVDAAKKADAAIIMVGDDEAEGHDHSIELPTSLNAMIEAVAHANPKTIVVLKSGSAITMPWINSVPAVLEVWYPGQEDGNAVAAVLFGDVNPSGKLPITFPRSVKNTLASKPAQYPGDGHTVQYTEGLEVGYRAYQANHVQPLFPFGFGLSYTTFSYSNLTVSAPSAAHSAEVHFRLTNTGHRKGAEVAQLYVNFPSIPEGNEPPRQLKGFRKITLAPGESRDVTIPLNTAAFSYWSAKQHAWSVQPGTYNILVGSSSEDLPLTAPITMH